MREESEKEVEKDERKEISLSEQIARGYSYVTDEGKVTPYLPARREPDKHPYFFWCLLGVIIYGVLAIIANLNTVLPTMLLSLLVAYWFFCQTCKWAEKKVWEKVKKQRVILGTEYQDINKLKEKMYYVSVFILILGGIIIKWMLDKLSSLMH